MSRIHSRIVEAPEFTVGKTTRRFLPQGNVVAGYTLRATYDYTMTGGTGAGAVRSDAAHRIIDELEIKVPGGQGPRSLVAIKGHTLAVLDEMFQPAKALQTPPTAVAAATSQTNRESLIHVPVTIPRSFQPEEFALPTSRTKVEAVVKWGAASDPFTTAIDGTPAFANTSAELEEQRYEGPEVGPGRNYGVHLIRNVVYPVTQSGKRTIELDGFEGLEIARIIVEAMTGGSGGTGYTHDDDLIDSAALEINGVDVLEERARSLIQSRNAQVYNLASRKTGVVVFDAAEDQRTTAGQLWPVVGPQAPRVICEVDASAGSGDRQLVLTVLCVKRPTPRTQ